MFRGRMIPLLALVALLAGACANSSNGSLDISTDQAEVLSQIINSPTDEEERVIVADIELKRQESISNCMASDGFEYVPVAPSTEWQQLFESPDFAVVYGFGISTTLEPRFNDDAPPDDPNQLIRDRQDNATLKQYDLSFDNCFRDALSNINPDRNNVVRFDEDISLLLADVDDLTSADPRTIEAAETWRDCAGGFGYRYNDPEEMFADLGQMMEPFASSMDEAVNELLAVDRKDEALDLRFEDILDPPDLAELRGLQSLEIRLASELGSCIEELSATKTAVRQSILRDFVDSATH